MITITAKAREHLSKLYNTEMNEGAVLHLQVVDANTPYTHAELTFETVTPAHAEKMIFHVQGLPIMIDPQHRSVLEDTQIDLDDRDPLNKELAIHTPHLQPLPMQELPEGSLLEKVHFLIETEINPALAMHGGFVRLMEVDEASQAHLQFGGGCQGCQMIDVTLKQGIERELLQKVPELDGIVDVTDHSDTSQAYY